MKENEAISIASLQVDKPKAMVLDVDAIPFTRNHSVQDAIADVLAGNNILIQDFYSTGLVLLKELKIHLKRKFSDDSFKGQREFRFTFKKRSNQILLRIVDLKLDVKKAPYIGWLERFYSNHDSFILSFPQVQGLNSAWQWYVKGVSIPVLRNRLHPFYGTYFPTRFEHLQLFDNWLNQYDGPKKTAIDVGIGSGVLSFMLMKHGFQKSYGTDINPNAIIGLHQCMAGTKLSRKIELAFGHLFAKWTKRTELIVFNPPWLPTSTKQGPLDDAIYYNSQLFPDFFEEATDKLLPDGRIVLLFSNLAQVTELTDVHPVEDELANGGRFVQERMLTSKVGKASSATKRDQHWRSRERVELWILKRTPEIKKTPEDKKVQEAHTERG
jgi:hypothetical protein